MESPDEVIEGSGEEETTGKRSKLKIKIWEFSGLFKTHRYYLR